MTDQIRFFNTFSGKKEEFFPLEPDTVKMYVCGVTPYDACHLGHARCYVFFDTVRRFLEQSGFAVTYVQNFTDIDDKIIERSSVLGISPSALAEREIGDYFERMDALNVKRAGSYPRVTENIPKIVAYIERLLGSGFAYRLEDGVYFSVRKFGRYGKLSKRSADGMISGTSPRARLEVNEKKKDPLDFALWKSAKSGEPSWDSPWGRGRPGWHIECSVMSMASLGETFDIHGGGQDLIFPHHENEIAQSESLTNKPFARYWLHNGFVTVNREKMSKSLGNFFTLREIFERFSPETVRFFLLSRHYKTPLDFSNDLLEQAKSAWDNLNDVYDMAHFVFGNEKRLPPQSSEPLEDFKSDFISAMSDDFNTEKAIAVLFSLKDKIVQTINNREFHYLERSIFTLNILCGDYLGLKLMRPQYQSDLEDIIQHYVLDREKARKEGNWTQADNIREILRRRGFVIDDTPWGPRIRHSRASGNP